MIIFTTKRHFVLDPTQKIIDEKTKNLIRKTLLERISLEGICRVFDVSMPWLLEFINELIAELQEDLNAEVVTGLRLCYLRLMNFGVMLETKITLNSYG